MSNLIYYPSYLAHHGIKGQKWGVRRYQNPDGSYTAAGRARYGIIGEQMNADQKSASERYQRWGISKDKADKLSEEKKEMMKKIAIGVGIAVGSAAVVAAAYYGGAYVRRNILGVTIKAGTTLQTLASDPNRLQTGEDFYTAFKNKDKIRYRSRFGQTQNFLGPNENKFNIKAEVTNNIKLAPRTKAANVMNDLIKKDPEYANYVKDSFGMVDQMVFYNPVYMPHKALADSIRKNPAKLNNLSSTEKKLVYEMVNLNQVSHDPRAQTLFNELKSKGFGGIIDTNDAFRSGFNTDAAIIFDTSNLIQKSAEKMSNNQINSAKVMDEAIAGTEYLLALSPAVAGIIGINVADNKSQEFDAEVRKNNNIQ